MLGVHSGEISNHFCRLALSLSELSYEDDTLYIAKKSIQWMSRIL